MPVLLQCKICGNKFFVKPSQVERSKYCSILCKNKGLKKKPSEKNITTVSLKCKMCGKVFVVEKWREKLAKYCSRKCTYDAKKVNKIKKCEFCGKTFKYKKKVQKYCSIKCMGKSKQLNTKFCEQCGKPFKPYKSFLKYCSVKCAGKSREGGNNCNYKGLIEFKCEWCGKTLKSFPSRKGRKRFCSEKCRRDWLKNTYRGENSPLWLGGSKDSRGENWTVQRELALKRDKYKCQDCGMTQKESLEFYNYSLSVHHIKPFYLYQDYFEANNLHNLITLCISCHQKRESKNKTNRRKLNKSLANNEEN